MSAETEYEALAKALAGLEGRIQEQRDLPEVEEIKRLRFAFEHIMFIGQDCPKGQDQVEFYKNGLYYACTIAAKALEGQDIRNRQTVGSEP